MEDFSLRNPREEMADPPDCDRSPPRLPKMLGARKIVEICTYTMMMSATAVQSPNLMWQAMVPISIENGFDLSPKNLKRYF